ncbi:MAG: hypothetical protein H6642_09100 [Caldilineaceae bacterium]|nr:hypothetical protein [Caldilineaceae bacterium]
MFKRRITHLVAAIALAAVMTGGFQVAAEALGLHVTPTVYACLHGSTSGGGGGC